MKKYLCLPVLAVASGAAACDLCAVYSAPLGHHVHEKGFHLGVSEQFTHFGTVQEDGREVSNPSRQRMDSSISQLIAGYQFSARAGVQFNLPVIHRAFRRIEGEAVESGSESGLGDVSLLGNFIAFRHDEEKWSFIWQVLGGVKFPTGDTDRLREELEEDHDHDHEEGAVHGHDLALGSGSYDGIVGTEVYARWQRLFFTAGVQYTIRSRGDFGYRYADDLTWAGGPGIHAVFTEDWVVGLQAVVSGEHKRKDEVHGEKADDTAITSVFLGPQVTVTWKGKFSAEIGAAFPVHIDNSALQIVPDYRVLGALNWRF